MRSIVASRAPGAFLLASAIAAPAYLLAQATSQPSRPSFRSDIEHVQVDVRVLDGNREPVRGLTPDLFQVFEDGVLQDIDSFAAIDLQWTPIRQETREIPIVRADAASNIRESGDDGPIGIAYLVIVDDHSIFKARTTTMRALLRNFVLRHLGPNDQAAFVSTGYSRVFQDFTADKNRLLAAASRVFGDSAGSPTIQRLMGIQHRASSMDGPPLGGGDHPTPPPRTPPGSATLDKAVAGARTTYAMLAEAVAAMGSVGARSRAILFVTEGNPITTVTELEGFTFFNQSTGADQPLSSGVPIYPIDPRGLTSLADESIQLADLTMSDAATIRDELAISRERMYSLADDTGGFVIANNNVDEGLDRIARVSGTYYSIGYYTKTARRDGKYHRIEVKVNHPGVHVVTRRG